jgi:hypothetical protein
MDLEADNMMNTPGVCKVNMEIFLWRFFAELGKQAPFLNKEKL